MRRVTDTSLLRTRTSDTERRASRRPGSRRPSRRAAPRRKTPENARASAAEAERSATQRGRLLHAASVVFAKGFHQASVAAIVKEAGMSRRTFYEHFNDLTDALLQLYDRSAAFLLHSVEAAYRTAGTPRARIEAAMAAYVTTIAANADLARIVYAEIRAAGPEHAGRHQATLARFATLITRWAADARAAKIIRRAPDEVAVYAALYGIEGTAMRYVDAGQERRLAAATPRLVDFVIAAFM